MANQPRRKATSILHDYAHGVTHDIPLEDARSIMSVSNIEDSEPYRMLINAICGDKTPLTVRFPFDRYQKFDDTKIPHDFILTFIEKRPVDLTRTYRKYAVLVSAERIGEIIAPYEPEGAGVKVALSKVAGFIEELTGKPIDTLADFLQRFEEAIIKPSSSAIQELGDDKGFSRAVAENKITDVVAAASDLTSEGYLRFTGKVLPKVNIFREDKSENKDTLAESQLKAIYSAFASACPDVTKGASLHISSTYRPPQRNETNAHTIRGNAVDCTIKVKGSSGSLATDIGRTKKFFAFLLLYWNGGVGIDTTTDNCHIHCDLRAHFPDAPSGLTTFREEGGKSISESVCSLTESSGLPRSPFDTSSGSSVVEAYRKATGDNSFPDEVAKASRLDIVTEVKGKNRTPEAESVCANTLRILKALLSPLQGIHNKVFRAAFAQCYALHTIDLSDCIESLSIQTKPGTSTYIPLEGSPDPVVQSTGGQVTTVNFTAKLTDITKLATLMTMFVFDELTEMRIGMLLLSHIITGTRGNTQRFKYLNSYFRTETLRRVIQSFNGPLPSTLSEAERVSTLINRTPDAIRLNEPIHIQNDILGALGLSTFLPIRIYVSTLDEAAGVYSVSMSLQYLNYGMRSLEDLTISRFSKAPILPISGRLSALIDGNNPDDEKFKTPVTISLLSMYLALSEFLPIYTLYRVHEFAKKVEELSSRSDSVVDFTNIDTYIGLCSTPSEPVDSWSKVEFPTPWHYKNLAAIVKDDESEKKALGCLATLGVYKSSLFLYQLFTDSDTKVTDGSIEIDISMLMLYAYFDLIDDAIRMYRSSSTELSDFISRVCQTLTREVRITRGKGSDEHISFGNPISVKTASKREPFKLSTMRLTVSTGGLQSKVGIARFGFDKFANELRKHQPESPDPVSMAPIQLVTNLASIMSYFTRFSKGIIEKDGLFVTGLISHATRIALVSTLVNHIAESIIALTTASFLDAIVASSVLLPTTIWNPTGHIAKQIRSDKFATHVYNKICERILRMQNAVLESGIDPQVAVLSGLYVDGILPNNVRGPFCDIMRFVLNGMSTTLIRDANGPFVKLIEILNPTIVDWARDIIVAVVASLLPVIVFELSTYAVILILSLIAGPVALAVLIVKVAKWLIDVTLLLMSLVDTIVPKIAEITLQYSTLSVIGVWLKEEVLRGLSPVVLLEMCMKTSIWIPSALEFGDKIYDNNETTYMDYPAVIGPSGKPLPPDFYIYKIGMLRQGYDILTNEMESICGEIEEYAKKVTDNPSELIKQFYEQIGNYTDSIPFEFELDLRKILESISNEQHGDIIPMTARDMTEIVDLVNKVIPLETTKGVLLAVSGHIGGTPIGTTTRKPAVLSVVIEWPRKDSLTISVKVNDSQVTMLRNAASDVIRLGKEANAIQTLIESRAGFKNYKLTVVASQIGVKAAATLLKLVQSYDMQGYIQSEGNWYTLGRFLMAKNLVGSLFEQVGASGVALTKSYMQRVGTEQLLGAASKRYGYLFPTVKLYFMEERSEAYYLFDDLYSYASIVSVKFHTDRESPQQTCFIDVTNIYGKLTNVFSDMYGNADENYFFRSGSKLAPINSMIIRPGTKVKLQMGYSPILTENDTIFIGEIVSVTPGAIVRIEARSYGSVFLTELSEEQVKVYGESTGLIGLVIDKLKRLIGGLVSDGKYLYPITKIVDIISYILSDLRSVSEYISDYTINPDISAQVSGELKGITRNLVQGIKETITPYLSRTFSEAVGLDVSITQNRQLFENIKVRSTQDLSHLFNLDQGQWVVFNETVWEALNELNMLLPNHIITVRPHASRSTLVWGSEDDYYRYTRSVDTECFFTNAVIERLSPIVEFSDDPKLANIAAILRSMVEQSSKNPDILEGAKALIALIAFNSQTLFRAYAGRHKDAGPFTSRPIVNIYDPDEKTIAAAFQWFLGGSFKGNTGAEGVLEIAKWFSIVADVVPDMMRKVASSNPSESFNVSVADLTPIRNMVSGFSEIQGIFALSMEYGADITLTKLLRLAYSRSTSHRQVVSTHIKVSGVDIIQNAITLTKVPNTVNIEFPEDDASPDELVAPSLSISNTGEIPIHYKLSPRVWNVYTSYFKNANVFPSSRYPVVASVASSILARLAGGMYQGSITIIGDPRIRENDIIILWDEANDLYGAIRVKAHTLIMSAEEGCISVIEPELISRTVYHPSISFVDTTFALIEKTMAVVFTLLAARGLTRELRTMLPILRIRRMVGEALNESKPSGTAVMRLLSRFTAGRKFLDLVDNSIVKEINNYMKTNPKAKESISDYVKHMASIRSLLENAHVRKLDDSSSIDMLNIVLKSAKTVKVKDIEVTIPDDLLDSLTGNTRNILSSVQKKIFEDGSAVRETISRGLLSEKRYMVIFDEIQSAYVNAIAEQIKGTSQHTKAGKALQKLLGALKSTYSNMDDATIMKEIAKELLKYEPGNAGSINNAIEDTAKKFVKEVYDSMEKRNIAKEILRQGVDKVTARGPEFDKMFTNLVETIFDPKPFFKESLFKAATFLMNVWLFKESVQFAREFFNMIMVNRVLADSVVLSPLYFRGEPFVCGLDGVTKEDGEKAGLYDIFTARLSALKDAIGYSISEPIIEMFIDIAHMQEEMRRNVSTRQ